MKKSIVKNIVIFVLMIVMLSIYVTPVLAGDDFNPDDWRPADRTGETEFAEKANYVIGIIRVVGSLVSVAALALIGVKYMMGSLQEKAEYKKTMLPYLIGAFLVFGGSNLLQILYEWAQGL